MDTLFYSKNIRVINLEEHNEIIYIKHLGVKPYNEIKFACGKRAIVCYSLTYWHTVFKNFQRINKGVLINPQKIISEKGAQEVELTDNSIFVYSRRRRPHYLTRRSNKNLIK